MKLSAIAAVVLSAGLAQVAATPIRIVIASAQQDGSEALESVRFGHAVPPAPAVATWKIATADGAQVGPVPTRKPCRGRMNRMSQKGIKVSNAFRQFFGMPLIEANPHRLHIMPIGASHKPEEWHQPQFGDFKILGVSNLPHLHNTPVVDHPHPHRHGRIHHHGFQKRPFTERLNHALLHLGRWEGRAVAFVLGCGIGVLLRLFWVLSIVMYRAIRGHRDDEHEYSHITFIEEYEEPPVQNPPPIYVYPVDEKVALKVDEAPKAPTTTEESN